MGRVHSNSEEVGTDPQRLDPSGLCLGVGGPELALELG
jgi:hypothetical protein